MSGHSGSPEAGGVVQMAAFRVGSQQYVVDIMRIREIINPLPVTPVPSATRAIEGVINLRGVIIPVIDLRKYLDVDTASWSPQPKVIVVMVANNIFGLVVDEVMDVVRLPREAIKPAPQFGQPGTGNRVVGVCEHQGRLLILLNLKEILEPALATEQEPAPAPEE